MNHQLLNEVAEMSGINELNKYDIEFARNLIMKCYDLALNEWACQDNANDYPAADEILNMFIANSKS